jgi:acrylyl-CoA reductase (NADPH)
MSNAKTFKALVVEETSDGEFKKSIQQRNVSDLPENDLLIEVHYSSLNFKDAMSPETIRTLLVLTRQAS